MEGGAVFPECSIIWARWIKACGGAGLSRLPGGCAPPVFSASGAVFGDGDRLLLQKLESDGACERKVKTETSLLLLEDVQRR